MIVRFIALLLLLLVLAVGLLAQTTGLSVGGLCTLMAGSSAPESSVTAGICTTYLRSGTAGVYVKESGSGNTGWQQVATAANTLTLTNKTVDAEGTGNVITVSTANWIQAARCDNATATSPEWSFPTSNPGVPACQTGTNTQYGTMDFADGGTALSAQTHLKLPADWTGTMDARIKWLTSATSGDVVWQVATSCVADAETSDPAFNTASTVTDTAKGTTLQTNDATITGVTITGCAAGELLFLKLTRDPTTGADTLAATARLIGLELITRRAL